MYVTWQLVNADGVLARSGENGEARKKCAVQYHWEAIVTNRKLFQQKQKHP